MDRTLGASASTAVLLRFPNVWPTHAPDSLFPKDMNTSNPEWFAVTDCGDGEGTVNWETERLSSPRGKRACASPPLWDETQRRSLRGRGIASCDNPLGNWGETDRYKEPLAKV